MVRSCARDNSHVRSDTGKDVQSLKIPYGETVGAILSACANLSTVDIRFGSTVTDLTLEGAAVAEAEAVLADGTRLRAPTFVDTSGRSPLHAFTGSRRDVTTSIGHVLRMATIPVTPAITARNRFYFSSAGWFTYVYPISSAEARVFVGLPRELDAPVFGERGIDLVRRLRPS